MTEAGEVAEALGIREAELREAVDDDTTAAALLGQFTPDVPLPEAKAVVEAWLAGEPVTQPNGNGAVDDRENPSSAIDNDTETPEGDGAADAGEAKSTGAMGDMSIYRPACEGEGAYRPACDTDDLEARAHAAFADAIEFYHRQLDTELPVDYADTARDYYENVRGWSADTIEAKRLGYAPGDCADQLVAYLHRQGHDRDAIKACGLFYEDGFSAHFNGRFVLPYFDEAGAPVYAISRSLDRDEGGHPDDHHGDQKYTKVIKGKDYSVMDEPIYGLDTLDEDTDRLLVAGGIADAITLHEAGYACISPVTTVRFKSKHEAEVADLIERYDLDRVYQLNDAERPTVDARETDDDDHDSIRDKLTIQTYGEGLRGAFGNVEFLRDAGADPYLVDFPGGDDDLRKLDPDDYLKENWGTVEAVLASAKPARDHRGYRRWGENQRTREVTRAKRNLPTDATADGDASALFDLTFTDVSGLSDGFRGMNPLGHHGESEDYFTVGEGVGYDWKYPAAYNALTYLLVEARERRASDPSGQLSDEEIFAAWKHAKQTGHIADDDPVPRRALHHVAREATEWDGELVEQTTADGDTFDALPTAIYNDALRTIREEFDLDHGRHLVGSRDADAEPVAVLPPAARDLSTATTWDWQNADADNPGLSKQDVRDRTAEAIADAYARGDRALVEAIPGAGKSYGAVLAAAETGEPVTICTGRGQKEQYDQYQEWAAEFGLRDKRLPAFTETCPTARGDHGDDWKETVMNWYRRGASGQTIHNIAEDALGRPLPCQVAETGEAVECPHRHAWDFDPDDYDLLIGHYSHAHTQAATEDRTVVFDEFPGGAFEEILAPGDLQRAVSHYLGATDELPFEDFTDLMDHRHGDGQRRADALAHYLDGNGRLAPDADETAVFDDSGAHALAPIASAALLAADDLGNGIEHARFASGQAIYHRETGALAILRPPALQYAEGVVALDGTPTPRMWNRCLGEQLTHREVLADDQKRDFIENGLGARYVRTTEAVKPYNSADHVNSEQDAALLEAIAEQHDQADDVTEYVDDTRHYGNVLGSNEYADVRVGAVIGSNHYGDDYLKRWGAYLGDTVERENGKGANLSYTGAGDEILTHMRENETLQAAMRFGRDGNGAVVYVHTDTLPDWVPVEAEARVLSTHSDGMRDVVDALADAGTATTAEVAAHPGVDVGERQVRDHLETLRENGAVGRRRDPDDRRRIVWQDDGLHRVNENGDVELEPVDAENMTEDEVAELARTTYYTWEFRNSGADHPSPGAAPGSGAVEAGPPAPRGDDPPPKPGD